MSSSTLNASAAANAARRGSATSRRILIGADLFFVVYLVATAVWMRGRSGADLRAHFADADEGGALIVLILNTAAYSAEIFHGGLRNVPKGDLEAAEAYGL